MIPVRELCLLAVPDEKIIDIAPWHPSEVAAVSLLLTVLNLWCALVLSSDVVEAIEVYEQLEVHLLIPSFDCVGGTDGDPPVIDV
ncbi:hypothetical protein P389DRAFT_170751 [Cystobasidium minutum MCA 4210]|uniref:uncharacterized protein n=1 Tax=Cystobasidium minutum MCA 4210 TaxID=1397322 RepID=UPI0034CF08A9|eukprot:jgi/Rhomi1/170751/fgenesh1_kg.4_\